MRPTGICRRNPALVVGIVIVALVACAVTFGVMARAWATDPVPGATAAGMTGSTGAAPAAAGTPEGAAAPAAAPLSVSVDRPLTLVNEPVTVTIVGDLAGSLAGAKLVVRIKGPASAEQVGQAAAELQEIDKVVVVLGGGTTTPTSATTPGTGPAGTDEARANPAPTTSSSTTSSTTTTVVVTGNDAQAIASGALDMSVRLAAHRPDVPGAYQLAIEVKTGSTVLAAGQTWIGKAAVREKPLDFAFVLPVSLGVHRDPDGVFYDSVLEDALGTDEGITAPGGGSLRTIAGISELFPSWNLTLAVEPVLLTQLRDMADGYTRRDVSGKTEDVPAGDVRVQNADALLGALRKTFAGGSIEAAVSPYAGADLSMLAAQKWRDGFEQIQMGKQELQETLGLGAPLTGAFSPGLDLSSASLGFYAGASIDHVVVGSDLAALLTEPTDAGVVAVRARDEENHRATLVFADAGLSRQMAAPWDPNLLFATLAAELAAAPRDAFVAAPALQFELVPDSYIEAVGTLLGDLDWVKTQTVSGLLRNNSPGTRPIMLKTTAGTAAGYIESALLDDLRAAHDVVTSLAELADATRTPVEAVHRLLYIAESGWWWRPGTSPQQASIGLRYAKQARESAQAELDKIGFAGADSSLITGSRGVVELSLDNEAGYVVNASLHLAGTGLTLPDGDIVDLDLQPGKTVVPVRVAVADGTHRLDAKLVAGQTTLDEITHAVRFITVKTVLPFVIVGGLLVLAGLYFLAKRLLKGRTLKGRIRWPLKRRRAERVG